MSVANAYFEHLDVHTCTWYRKRKDMVSKSTDDIFYTRKNMTGNVHDVRFMIGLDVGT